MEPTLVTEQGAPEVANVVDAPAPDAPVAAVQEVAAEPPVETAQPAVEEKATTEVAPHVARGHGYPSLYDSTATTLLAIVLGVSILGGIQWFVARIFKHARDEYAALTQFVLSMVGLIIGAYLVDLIISGPDTSLLSPSEKATILDFIKTTCGLVFGYYFGSRSKTPSGPE
jgi:hypothetical protein